MFSPSPNRFTNEPDARVETQHFDVLYPSRWAAQVHLLATLLELAALDLESDLGISLISRPLIIVRRGAWLSFRCDSTSGTIWLDFMFRPALDSLIASVAFGILHELSHLYFRFPEKTASESWANFGALFGLRQLAHRPFPVLVRWGYLLKDYFTIVVLLRAASLIPGQKGHISRASLRIWHLWRCKGIAEVRQSLQEARSNVK